MINPGLTQSITAAALPTGAATSAKQDTGNASLADIAGNYAEAWANKTGDSTIIYVGESAIDSTTSSAVWRICEVNTTTGRVKWAGSGLFTQVWDSRESISFN